MRGSTYSAALIALAASMPVAAQLNNNDGTVISVEAGAPVRVVNAIQWSCHTAGNDFRISGRIGQFVSERFDASDRLNRQVRDFLLVTIPRIAGRPVLSYGAHDVSGNFFDRHRFTFTWPSHMLKLELAVRPSTGTFELLSNSRIVATGSCTYRSEAFRRPS